MRWNVKILTLFPSLYPGHLGVSVLGNALRKSSWSIEAKDLRDYAVDKHSTIDDYPYGGGHGMLLKCDIVANGIEDFFNLDNPTIVMSPSGKKLTTELANSLVAKAGVNIVCPRFEGIDARVIQYFDIMEVSIGDYVLSSGDLAAQVLIDACVRRLPDVLSSREGLQNESFSDGMNGILEHPQYTKPRVWRELEVPEILISGHHENIKKWKKQQSIEKTRKNRSDLLDNIN